MLTATTKTRSKKSSSVVCYSEEVERATNL